MIAALLVAPILALAAAAATPPSAPKPLLPGEVRMTDGFLVTRSGAPLYEYDNDTMVGMSHCSGACAQAYPPLIAPAGAAPSGDWTLVPRDDGASQWAFHDKPLYTSTKTPADVAKAEAEGGNWRRARSDGSRSLKAAPTSGPAAAAQPGGARLSRTDSSQFTCEGDRKMLAQFVSRDSGLTAVVDMGEGAHALPLMPWAGGEPQIAWSDGQRTLVWTSGVKLMWMDGGDHLACGRAAHHHDAMQ